MPTVLMTSIHGALHTNWFAHETAGLLSFWLDVQPIVLISEPRKSRWQMSETRPTSIVGNDCSLRSMARLLLLSTILTLTSVLIDISLPPPLGLQLAPSSLPIAAFIGGYFMLLIVVPSALGCAGLCYDVGHPGSARQFHPCRLHYWLCQRTLAGLWVLSRESRLCFGHAVSCLECICRFHCVSLLVCSHESAHYSIGRQRPYILIPWTLADSDEQGFFLDKNLRSPVVKPKVMQNLQ